MSSEFSQGESKPKVTLPEPDAAALASRRLMTRDASNDFSYDAPQGWRDARAWLISCVLHTVTLLMLAVFFQPRLKGTGDLLDRPVGIAVFHQTASGNVYELSASEASGGDDSADASAAAENSANPSTVESSASPRSTEAPIDVSELTKDLLDYQTKTAGTPSKDGAAQGFANGLSSGLSKTGTATGGSNSSGLGANGSGKTTASFMGLKGTGANFVYVLDRSASMDEFGGAPMQFAKSELMKSIASLSERNQFQVVFYNDSPGSLSPATTGGKLLAANDTNKEKASRFVKAIRPLGGTEHIPGLKMGLSFGPDVLFFLTDAAEPAMNESQLIEIQTRAERAMTTIHTVQFNRGPAPNDGGWIRELAERNRGTYRYVDITDLER